MKIFICNRTIDNTATLAFIETLLAESDNSIAILRETEHTDNWKDGVERKMQDSDFVLFVVGDVTFTSEQMMWEYVKAKQLNKHIIGLKLSSASEDSILFCQGFQVFETPKQLLKFLSKTYDDDRKLKLEQYKIMVSSTEKVTDSRMKVNNLFFTITSSILSVSFVLGKTFNFTIAATIGMVVLTALSFLVSLFWQKLIDSYGKLNKGKFKVIDKIEKQLRTNMFDDEWRILTEEIKYEPNSMTELKIIKYFRVFIVIIGALELGYLVYLLYPITQPFLTKCI